MFRREEKKAAKQMAQMSNFERCPHKEVEFFEYPNSMTGIARTKLTCPKLALEKVITTTAQSARMHPSFKNAITLHYPASNPAGQNQWTYNSGETAIAHLAETATALACRGCTYPDKTLVQIAEIKKAQEEEKLAVMKVDVERLQLELEMQSLAVHRDDLQRGIDRLPDMPPPGQV